MNRSSRFGSWAWSAWCLIVVACSSTSALPPPLPDCQGGKDALCSVQPGAGGAGSAGGSGGAEDSGTTTTTTTSTGACGNAGTFLGATSSQCELCIETGAASTTGANCCMPDNDCSIDSACVAIVRCTAALCGLGDTACVSQCINTTPSGATDFNDFIGCLTLNCPSCPNPMPAVASEQ